MANQQRHSYVQFYPSDWMGGVAFMPPMAEWLYLQICLYNWDKREPLPPAQARLRLSRSPTWNEDLEALIDAGKVIKTHSGSLFVERAMVEAERAYELWEKKSRGGRRSQASQSQGESETGDKSDGNTHSKSAASNESESESEILPNGNTPLPPTGDLIFAIPGDVMKAFREHRRKLKAPLTQRAEELLIKKLEAIHRDRGHDPTAVLEQSIERGWKGVFELKGDHYGNGNRDNRGSGNGLLDATLDEMREGGRFVR